jgi:hypothetical protein
MSDLFVVTYILVLETFQATTATDGCIVHNSKYQSKFNNAVNLIRRGKNYAKEVYNELPKRCCSCHGKTGEYSTIKENYYIHFHFRFECYRSQCIN